MSDVWLTLNLQSSELEPIKLVDFETYPQYYVIGDNKIIVQNLYDNNVYKVNIDLLDLQKK